jgi:hypothetical protein
MIHLPCAVHSVPQQSKKVRADVNRPAAQRVVRAQTVLGNERTSSAMPTNNDNAQPAPEVISWEADQRDRNAADQRDRRAADQRERTAKDPAYAEKERDRRRKGMKKAREDGGFAERERARARQLYRARRQRLMAAGGQESLVPKTVALDVYADYQQLMRWPQVPPTGLRVAVDRQSDGPEGRAATVVTLDVPQQTAAPSGAVAPPLVADPSIDLTDPRVRAQIFAAGTDERAYQTAVQTQAAYLLDRPWKLAFGTDAGQDDLRSASPEPMFGDVDLDALVQSGLAGAYSALDVEPAWDTPAHWPAPVHYAAPHTLGHLTAEGAGQGPNDESDMISRSAQNVTVAAHAHLQAAGTYDPAAFPPGVAYTRWDNSALHEPGPQAGAYPSGTQQTWARQTGTYPAAAQRAETYRTGQPTGYAASHPPGPARRQ